MLVHVGNPAWYYIEPTKTGTSTLCEGLPGLLGDSVCTMLYRKHWPILPPAWFMAKEPKSVITIRNPYSRAVSSWWHYANLSQHHDSLSFLEWTERAMARRAENGIAWRDHNHEHHLSHPQTLWYDLQAEWDFVLKTESLEQDTQRLVQSLHPHVKWRKLIPKNSITARPPWESYYRDRRAVSNIQDLYQTDFERFAGIYSTKLV